MSPRSRPLRSLTSTTTNAGGGAAAGQVGHALDDRGLELQPVGHERHRAARNASRTSAPSSCPGRWATAAGRATGGGRPRDPTRLRRSAPRRRTPRNGLGRLGRPASGSAAARPLRPRGHRGRPRSAAVARRLALTRPARPRRPAGHATGAPSLAGAPSIGSPAGDSVGGRPSSLGRRRGSVRSTNGTSIASTTGEGGNSAKRRDAPGLHGPHLAPCTSAYDAWRSGSNAWRRSATPPGHGTTRRSAPATGPSHRTRGANGMMPAGIASASGGHGPRAGDVRHRRRVAGRRGAVGERPHPDPVDVALAPGRAHHVGREPIAQQGARDVERARLVRHGDHLHGEGDRQRWRADDAPAPDPGSTPRSQPGRRGPERRAPSAEAAPTSEVLAFEDDDRDAANAAQ
jgi:hypothetical protein